MMADFRLTWNGTAATAAMTAGAGTGLLKAAEHVLGEARQVVPIEEATLSNSGATSVDVTALKAAISFDTVYAVRQHEELSYRHDRGRTAKYLETPLNATRLDQQQIIAAEIQRRLR